MCGGCGASTPPMISPWFGMSVLRGSSNLRGTVILSGAKDDDSQLHTNILGFGKKSKGLPPSLPPEAAVAHSAERDAQIAQQPAVPPHGARIGRGGHAVGTLQVARPQGCRQTVLRRVRERDRFLFIVVWCARDHRSEALFLQHPAIARQSDDHRRLDEPSHAVDALSAVYDGAAFLARQCDVTEDFLAMRFTDERADVGRFVERIADAQLLRRGDETIHELIVNRSLDKNSRSAETD